jgi:hypothetical protein
MTDVNDRATPEAKLPKGMIQLLPRDGAEPEAAEVSGRAAFPDMYDHSLLAGVPALVAWLPRSRFAIATRRLTVIPPASAQVRHAGSRLVARVSLVGLRAVRPR